MFRGAFTAIRDAARKLFRAPAPVQGPTTVTHATPRYTSPHAQSFPLEQKHQTAKAERNAGKKNTQDWAREKTKAWKGKVILYSDRSYYCDSDGRFIRLQPGQSPEQRLNELAGRFVYAEPQAARP